MLESWNSAWFVFVCIREASVTEAAGRFEGSVEADDTHVGGP